MALDRGRAQGGARRDGTWRSVAASSGCLVGHLRQKRTVVLEKQQ